MFICKTNNNKILIFRKTNMEYKTTSILIKGWKAVMIQIRFLLNIKLNFFKTSSAFA